MVCLVLVCAVLWRFRGVHLAAALPVDYPRSVTLPPASSSCVRCHAGPRPRRGHHPRSWKGRLLHGGWTVSQLECAAFFFLRLHLLFLSCTLHLVDQYFFFFGTSPCLCRLPVAPPLGLRETRLVLWQCRAADGLFAPVRQHGAARFLPSFTLVVVVVVGFCSFACLLLCPLTRIVAQLSCLHESNQVASLLGPMTTMLCRFMGEGNDFQVSCHFSSFFLFPLSLPLSLRC